MRWMGRLMYYRGLGLFGIIDKEEIKGGQVIKQVLTKFGHTYLGLRVQKVKTIRNKNVIMGTTSFLSPTNNQAQIWLLW